MSSSHSPSKSLSMKAANVAAATSAAPWWQHMLLYQVYVRSFCDSNSDGVGDIPGLISKLDYFTALGVNVLWLSPIHPSPDCDHGYDVSDYRAIDPRFGSLKDFDQLIEQARARGIKIIIDGVFNHCSDQHPWFKQAIQDKKSEFRGFFHWSEKAKPNNWCSVMGRSAWQWCEAAGAFYLHSFLPQQPDLNWNSVRMRQEILAIMRFWLDRGVAGFRLDVFNCYVKDAAYRNNPRRRNLGSRLLGAMWPYAAQYHIYDRDRPQLADVLAPMHDLVKQYDGVLIGETMDEQEGYYHAARWVNSGHLDLAFNFKLLHCKWQASAMYQALQDRQLRLKKNAWPLWALSNHDFVRHASRWGRGHTLQKMRLAAILLLMVRGTPCIYQGEEIAMRQGRIPKRKLQDPLGKLLWPFYRGRDGARTPMQWDDSQYAGFSRVEPWMPENNDYHRRNVARQRADQDSLWCFYQHLLALRKSYPALQSGEMLLPPQAHPAVLSWLRYAKDDANPTEICIVLNLQSKALDYYMIESNNTQFEILLSTHSSRAIKTIIHASPLHAIGLAPYEGLILRVITPPS